MRAIRTVVTGRRFITPGVAELLAEEMCGNAAEAAHDQLSERELQVFLRLAGGETVGEAAEALALSVKTISTYRTRLMEKMGLLSNIDLTYYAIKNGLLQ